MFVSFLEPKDAVVVMVRELNRDGQFEGNVGADATLTCVAHGRFLVTYYEILNNG